MSWVRILPPDPCTLPNSFGATLQRLTKGMRLPQGAPSLTRKTEQTPSKRLGQERYLGEIRPRRPDCRRKFPKLSQYGSTPFGDTKSATARELRKGERRPTRPDPRDKSLKTSKVPTRKWAHLKLFGRLESGFPVASLCCGTCLTRKIEPVASNDGEGEHYPREVLYGTLSS